MASCLDHVRPRSIIRSGAIWLAVSSFATLVVAVGCTSFGADDIRSDPTSSGGSPSGSGPVDGTGRLPSLAFGPTGARQRVVQGLATKLALEVKRSDSVTGVIVVAASGLPPGVTVEPLTLTGTTGDLVVKASTSAPQGPFELTLEATSGTVRASAKRALIVSGASGAVDTTFGAGGNVALPTAVTDLVGLLVSGKDEIFSVSGCASQVCVAKLGRDGAVDASYGGTGEARLAMAKPLAVVLGADGKVTIGGGAPANGYVGRLTAAGAPDATLSSTGIVNLANGTVESGNLGAVRAVALGPNESTYVAFDSAQYFIGVQRLDKNGVSDQGFSGGLMLFRWSDRAETTGLFARPSGALVLSGVDSSNSGFLHGYGIAQFDGATGARDATFGANGSRSFPGSGKGGFGRPLSILYPDGRVLSAFSAGGVGADTLVLFDANGQALDSSWGRAGVADLLGTFSSPSTVARQSDGKILLSATPTGLARHLPSAAIDVAFGTAGLVDLTTTCGLIRALAVQSDGRILLLCKAPAGGGAAVVRLWD